ncbi:MAG TPA: DUF1801 domain-containing protein [Candidatus Saccharimonadales bacterium]|nr:DUF1801 domain-containing protein [Candidatus Saccharimonadales bacterium]
MDVVNKYIETLEEPKKSCVKHMYEIAREVAPDATAEMSYGMPALKYKGKGLVSIMANKEFLSYYPFASVGSLGVDISSFETTDGSIHFSVEKPISDDLLRSLLAARMKRIEASD